MFKKSIAEPFLKDTFKKQTSIEGLSPSQILTHAWAGIGRNVHRQLMCFSSDIRGFRLDYQPLFREISPRSSPEKTFLGEERKWHQ